MEKATEIRMVHVSTGSFESAHQIAKILVTEKLAACCSIIQNAVSIYGWQSSIRERHEYLLLIKTVNGKIDDMEERIIELSKDECPEILAMQIDSASNAYHSWLTNALMDE